MVNNLIRDLNIYEKPREKLIRFGPAKLTDEELIAIIIRSGGTGVSAIETAREVIRMAQGACNLVNTDISELLAIKNVNVAKATSLISAVELGLRISKPEQQNSIFANKPHDIFKLLSKELYKKTKEYLFLFSLDTRNKVIAKDILSIGSLNETIVSPREVFATALKKNAAAIILAHNHPSNDSTPSTEDINVTEKIARLGKEMNIPLLDHVIITDKEFTSLKQTGLFTTWSKGGEKDAKTIHT